MTERIRLYHHLQNQNRRQATALPTQQTSTNIYQPDDRPNFSIDNFTANNYRHPSSTTTTTDPSSSAQSSQSSDGCAISIFYSYLIAIFSSFLVVLGIYLSLTKFNYSFLSISLAGLLIEAFSACIYCISNIRSSRLARRKPRINLDDYILHNDSNLIENRNLENHNLNRHQQPISTITHILSNRDLNSNCVINENDNVHNSIENDPSAINNIETSPLPAQPLQDPLSRSEIDVDDERETNQNASITNPKLTRYEDQVDSDDFGLNNNGPHHNHRLPKNINQPESPEAISGEFSSSTTNLLENQQSSSRDTNSVTGEEPLPSQLSINLVSQFNNQLSDNDSNVKKTAETCDPVEVREELNTSIGGGLSNYERSNVQEPLQSSSEVTIVQPESTHYHDQVNTSVKNQVDSSDLIGTEELRPEQVQRPESSPLVIGGVGGDDDDQVEPQVRRKRSSRSGLQRPANLRRTLVRGLSGEQEIIEIDEEDLDNMSILPPPYESIAANGQQPSS